MDIKISKRMQIIADKISETDLECLNQDDKIKLNWSLSHLKLAQTKI